MLLLAPPLLVRACAHALSLNTNAHEHHAGEEEGDDDWEAEDGGDEERRDDGAAEDEDDHGGDTGGGRYEEEREGAIERDPGELGGGGGEGCNGSASRQRPTYTAEASAARRGG